MADQRPNIILIITDQQRYDTIRALGFPYMDTPNLDRLVNEGIAFTNCHITGPSCAPSRASFFTGNYPHTTGVLRNADVWPRTWIESLAQAGYHCVNIGKMHTWPYHASVGFHQRFWNSLAQPRPGRWKRNPSSPRSGAIPGKAAPTSLPNMAGTASCRQQNS